jgi:hypothetical protein
LRPSSRTGDRLEEGKIDAAEWRRPPAPTAFRHRAASSVSAGICRERVALRHHRLHRSAPTEASVRAGAIAARSPSITRAAEETIRYSPLMRGAPQSGLASHISRISLRVSPAIGFRLDRERQRQKSRKPWQCHRTTVTGLTRTGVSRQRGQTR